MGSSVCIAESKLETKLFKRDIPDVLLQIINFESLADLSGQVSVRRLLDTLKIWTDVFLTHNWGEGQRVHKFVSKVNQALTKLGITTCFDEERMVGDIPDQMTKGIDHASLVIVFVTRQYMEKVAGDNPSDSCKLEFGYSALKKTSAKMFAIVLEEEMLDSSKWGGKLGMTLGNHSYIPFLKRDEQSFDSTIEIINARIRSSVPIVSEVVASMDWNAVINAAEGEEEREVGQCNECGELATQHCTDCALDYCDSCCTVVHRLKVFQRHNRILVRDKVAQPLDICATHNESVTKNIYCCTCETLLCTGCISQGSHSKHIVNNIEALKPGSALMAAINREKDSLLASTEILLKYISELEDIAMADDIEKKQIVKDKFDAIRNALEIKEKAMIADVNESTKARVASLNEMRIRLEVPKGDILQAIHDIETKSKSSGAQSLKYSTKLIKSNDALKETLKIEMSYIFSSNLVFDEQKIISELNKSHSISKSLTTLNLVVRSTVTLESGRAYEFLSVTIEKGGVLTVNGWDGSRGGYLRLQVAGRLEIKAGGKINLDGKGYRGGSSSYQGESYTGLGRANLEANGGGGGGGAGGRAGAGGGYGTAGQNNGSIKGGGVYGDESISSPDVWMGSGGGGRFYSNVSYPGGNGGGSLYLTAETLANSGELSCCGGVSTYSGVTHSGGSGGSLKIVTSRIEAIGKLTATGGASAIGKGGDGRIRIEVKSNASLPAPNFDTVSPKPSYVLTRAG